MLSYLTYSTQQKMMIIKEKKKEKKKRKPKLTSHNGFKHVKHIHLSVFLNEPSFQSVLSYPIVGTIVGTITKLISLNILR